MSRMSSVVGRGEAEFKAYEKLLGSEVTPRRRAAIVALRMLDKPLSYRKIEQLTGVSKSTANDIFQHAVKNAIAKRNQARGEQQSSSAPGEEQSSSTPGEERLRNAVERAHDAKNWEEQFEAAKNCGKGPGSSVIQQVDAEIVSVPGENLSVLDLISADVLDPKKRSGRPARLTEAEKDHLIAIVQRDFKTRRMRLVDLRREAGLSHVSDTTVHRALEERGLRAYREELKFIVTSE
ncbi:hypothetical protein FN846DRAFT_972909, partial [Sphaerosporella brunnea]